MNTSMTINGTAMWLLALYVALARERGVPEAGSARHHAERHRQGVPRARARTSSRPSRRIDLIAETYEYCVEHLPQWNPSNICSYHLQEAGATPVQELAFALANAIGILDRVRERGRVGGEAVRAVRGPGLASSSTPACASSRRCARCARSASCGTSWRRTATASTDPELRRLPLRRAGQLARPHRAAAREQRVADPDRGAGRDALARRPLPRAAAAHVERGAVACRGRGTSSGRCGCSRSSRTRPTCSSTATCSPARRWSPPRWRRCATEARGRARRGSPGMGGIRGAIESGYLQARARALDGRADGADRARRAGGGRRQQVDRGPAVAARRRR